ncbi:MAG: GerMN domain-containing protein [candidate division FCPU426 bacterium]
MTTKHRSEWIPSVLAVTGVAVLAALGWWFVSWSGQSRLGSANAPGDSPLRTAKLFFALDNPRHFKETSVRIPTSELLRVRVKQLLEQFGPEAANSPFGNLPLPSKVRAVYLRGSGMLVVDFEKTVQYNQSVSAQEELAAVRSLLKTLVMNFPEVKAVKFLIGGQEAEALAGHVDISRALCLDDVTW